MNTSNRSLYAYVYGMLGAVIGLTLFAVGTVYAMHPCSVNDPNCDNNHPPITACTMDAKICPDGTAVGRVGPQCEFAACPGSTNYYDGDPGDPGTITIPPDEYPEPIDPTIVVTIPQKFVLGIGHTAIVGGTGMSITLDKIQSIQSESAGFVAFITVRQDGGCQGGIENRICLGMPSSQKSYQVSEGGYVDVLGGVRIALVDALDVNRPATFKISYTDPNVVPNPSEIAVRIPQTFSLELGQVAIVTNHNNDAIRLDRIALNSQGSSAFIAVTSRGGCSPEGERQGCLGAPGYSANFEVPLQGYVDVLVLGFRIAFVDAEDANRPATFRLSFIDGDQGDVNVQTIPSILEASVQAQDEGMSNFSNVIEIPNVDNESNPTYQVTANKNVRLFWLIPVSMPVMITVNAEGNIENVDAPWWSLLAW